MAVEESILTSTKKKLNIGPDQTEFDLDLIDFINGAFFKLFQIGFGPTGGFRIQGAEESWGDYSTPELANISIQEGVKDYVFVDVRLIFDPPGTPHHLTALKERREELAHTLMRERDLIMQGYVQFDPTGPGGTIILDGGGP